MPSEPLGREREIATRSPGIKDCTIRSVSQRGLTQIEMVVTLVIAATLIVGALLLVKSVAASSKDISTSLETTRTHIDFLSALRKTLNRGRVEAISADGSTLTYALPLYSGDDGSAIDRSGEIVWEKTDDEGVTSNRFITLAFVVERLLKESSIGKDVNNDGDLLDTFDIGYLTATSNIDGLRPLPRLTIALRNGNHGGDVTGDGIDDPLFIVDPDSLEVEISLSRMAGATTLKSLVTTCGIVDNNL